MTDRRAAVRKRSFVGGRIHLDKNAIHVDCVIRNLSVAGAKLGITDSVLVPDRFQLTIDRDGRRHDARIMWRTQDTIGLSFAPGEPPIPRLRAVAVMRQGQGAPPC